jgi:hypothetical protein
MPSLVRGESYSLRRKREEDRLDEPRFGDQLYRERQMHQIARFDVQLADWQKACERH